MTITIANNTAINVTQRDLITFERKLVAAAQAHCEHEVNVINTFRKYILFANWHPDHSDETPAEFASGEISLILDGVNGIAEL